MKPIHCDYKAIMKKMALNKAPNSPKEVTLAFIYDMESLDEEIYSKPNKELLTIFELEFKEGRQMSWYNWVVDVL